MNTPENRRLTATEKRDPWSDPIRGIHAMREPLEFLLVSIYVLISVTSIEVC